MYKKILKMKQDEWVKFDKRYKKEDEKDGRIYDRDYCRILYSSAFRRLQGKTQLLGINNEKFFRNRLTHSLEVAQIARSIALSRDYLIKEVYVVEAGALAHDIGNPPFGHSGEKKLNEIFDEIGGFEGNAQTLRVLRTIEKKNNEQPGLNLRYRTLLSIVKYFVKRKDGDDPHDKFIYDDDYHFLNDFINKYKVPVRTKDVQIVDISDEIAYATHDLEDCLNNHSFNIDDIILECKDIIGLNNIELLRSLESFVNIVNEVKDNYQDVSSYEFNALFPIELQSKLTGKFINDIKITKLDNNYIKKTGTRNLKELNFNKYNGFVDVLKKAIFNCVKNSNNVRLYERKGDKAIEYIANFYLNDKNKDLLPPEYRAENVIKLHNPSCVEKVYQKRLICDYIAGMTETFLIKQFESISGKKFDNILSL